MINLRRVFLGVPFKHRQGTSVEIMSSRCRNFSSHPSVGMIVIGDEILKAQVKDSNSYFACKLLFQHGVKVKKISVIRDDIQDIAKEIQKFSKKYEYVITSGGIGPTHDDLTFEAVATAFDDTLHYHPALVDIIKTYFGWESLASPGFKMARIPTKATLKFGVNHATGKKLAYPCVVLQNVYVFPGSPMFFETSFRSVCKDTFSGNISFATTEIYINAREELFADALTTMAKEHSNVCFGSYPERSRYYKARVTIESGSEEETKRARQEFCDLLPADVLVDYDRTPHVDCVAKFENFLNRCPRREIYESSFEKFLEVYEKSETVSIYLDGSIESVAMVHLARTADAKLRNSRSTLQAFGFEFDNLRPGMNEFLREVTDRYNVKLSILRYEDHLSRAIKYLTVLMPEFRTILLGKHQGSVRSNIYEDLASLSNGQDPEDIKVFSPLIDWSNNDVDTFAASLSLPYFIP